MDASAIHGEDGKISNGGGEEGNRGVSANKRARGIIFGTEMEKKRRVVESDGKDIGGVGPGPLGLKLSEEAKKEIIELVSKLHTSTVDMELLKLGDDDFPKQA